MPATTNPTTNDLPARTQRFGQAAKYLGVSRSIVQRWADKGCPYLDGDTLSTWPIPGLKKGRFLDKAQIELLKKKRKPPKDSNFHGFVKVNKRFGFTRNQLYSWRDKGCCYLDGQKLRNDPKIRASANRSMRETEGYDLSQLTIIDERMTAEKNGIFQDEEGVTWLTAKAANENYNLWEATLAEWAENGCPYLKGRKLQTKPFRRLNKRGKYKTVTTYRESELQEIVAAKQVPPDNTYVDSEGEWFYAIKVMKLTNWPKGNLNYYRKRKYPYLPEKKILTGTFKLQVQRRVFRESLLGFGSRGISGGVRSGGLESRAALKAGPS